MTLVDFFMAAILERRTRLVVTNGATSRSAENAMIAGKMPGCCTHNGALDACLRRFNWEQMMKKAFGCAAVAITLVALTAPVQAKG